MRVSPDEIKAEAGAQATMLFNDRNSLYTTAMNPPLSTNAPRRRAKAKMPCRGSLPQPHSLLAASRMRSVRTSSGAVFLELGTTGPYSDNLRHVALTIAQSMEPKIAQCPCLDVEMLVSDLRRMVEPVAEAIQRFGLPADGPRQAPTARRAI